MLQSIALACLLLFAGFSSEATSAQTADFETERAKLEASFVPKWMEFATDANRKKAFATRNRCYEAILVLEPEHVSARLGLKYKRIDGVWVQTGSKREPKDAKSNSINKLAAAVDLSFIEFRNAVLALIESHSEELGPLGVLAEQRSLLALDSESVLIHSLLGETNFRGQWMLTETASAIERRESLRKNARTNFDALSTLERAQPDGFEVELGINWTAGFETDRVRVFGTGEVEELEQILRAAHAMDELVFEAFGRRVSLDLNFTLYSLANTEDVALLFDHLPTVRKDPSAAITDATGGWLGIDSRFGNWSADRPRRVDGSIRGVVSQYMKNGFRIDLRHGWASEGFGLYLVEAMVGTRLTWFKKKGRYVEDEVVQGKEDFSLESPELNWMVEGREMLLAEDAPHLGALIGRPVGTMSPRDLLHAYLLASYMIEGRPEETPVLLDAIGNGGNPTKTFERILGEALPNIETRLLRWVLEVSQYEESKQAK